MLQVFGAAGSNDILVLHNVLMLMFQLQEDEGVHW